ncbi:MAG: VCBS repeat-containing protein [Polyangiaceae bacterium]
MKRQTSTTIWLIGALLLVFGGCADILSLDDINFDNSGGTATSGTSGGTGGTTTSAGDPGVPCAAAADCGAVSDCSGWVCDDGTCAPLTKPNGTACDDGDPCTTADGCAAGTCAGIPVACEAGMTCVMGACACDGVIGLSGFPLAAEGNQPKFAAASDLNGDGIVDLAVANAASHELRIVLGQGDGTFGDPTDYTVDTLPFAIAATDMNGDGDVDLAVTSYDKSTVTVLTNLGQGSNGAFSSGLVYEVATKPVHIAAVDCNSDSFPDLVVTSNDSTHLSVLVNKGDGTEAFQPTVYYETTSASHWVVSLDVDSDGKPDLATANTLTHEINILKGNGDCTFAAAVPYALEDAAAPWTTATADADLDGDADLIVGNYNGSVSILYNVGGSFPDRKDWAVGSPVFSVCAANLDADASPEIVAGKYQSSDLTVLDKVGDSYGKLDYPTATAPYFVTSADFNNDGHFDLVVLSDNVSVMLNQGDGTFTRVGKYVTGAAPKAVLAADLDGDNKPDLATANWDSDDVSILHNMGDGTFSAAGSYSTGMAPHSLAAGDFDGDGDMDLVAANVFSHDLSLLSNDGPTTYGFSNKSDYQVGTFPHSVVAADVDANGWLDMVSANFGDDTVTVWRNFNEGFTKVDTYSSLGDSPFCLAAAELNEEPGIDLATVNTYSYELAVMLGAQGFTGSYNTGPKPRSVAAADLDGDGLTDLVVANEGLEPTKGTVSVYRNLGSGVFDNPVHYDCGNGPRSVTTADFNGDGRPDIAVANREGGYVSLLLNLGMGQFGKPLMYATGKEPNFVVASDLNGIRMAGPGVRKRTESCHGPFRIMHAASDTLADGDSARLCLGWFRADCDRCPCGDTDDAWSSEARRHARGSTMSRKAPRHGGMGCVLAVRDLHLRRRVAVSSCCQSNDNTWRSRQIRAGSQSRRRAPRRT